MIRQSDAPQLNIIFRRNAQLRVEFEIGVALAKLRARLTEDGLVVFVACSVV